MNTKRRNQSARHTPLDFDRDPEDIQPETHLYDNQGRVVPVPEVPTLRRINVIQRLADAHAVSPVPEIHNKFSGNRAGLTSAAHEDAVCEFLKNGGKVRVFAPGAKTGAAPVDEYTPSAVS